MKRILILSTLLAINSVIFGQNMIAKYGSEFMSFGVGGRASALGGAFVALSNDVSAAYYNPAGLSNMNYPQIALMHEEKFGKLLNYDYMGVAIPYGTDMSFAVSLTRVAVDGLYDTRNALWDANGDGKLDVLDDRIDPSKVKEFSNADYILYLSFGKKVSNEFSYGANVKLIRRDIAEYSATGIGFDISAMYRPLENLTLGANVKDVTTTFVSWSTGTNEYYTPTAKIGAAYKVDFWQGTLMPLVDLDLRFENRKYASQMHMGPVSIDSHWGVEYDFKKLIAIRAGYSDVNEFTYGIGLKLPKLNIDYSYSQMNSGAGNYLGDDNSKTHRISLIVTLESKRFKRTE